jgi:hypothetical protein
LNEHLKVTVSAKLDVKEIEDNASAESMDKGFISKILLDCGRAAAGALYGRVAAATISDFWYWPISDPHGPFWNLGVAPFAALRRSTKFLIPPLKFFVTQQEKQMQKKSRKKMPRSDEIGSGKVDMDEDFGVLKHDRKHNPNSEPEGGRKRSLFASPLTVQEWSSSSGD